MPNLSNILNDSDEAKFPLGNGEILTIEYYPSRLTPKVLNRMQYLTKLAEKTVDNEEKQKEIEDEVYTLLLSFFESWDLEDYFPCSKCEDCQNGEKCNSKLIKVVPLNADSLDELPYWLFKEIIERFINPNKSAPQRKKRRS
jgi:hypothetical protein